MLRAKISGVCRVGMGSPGLRGAGSLGISRAGLGSPGQGRTCKLRSEDWVELRVENSPKLEWQRGCRRIAGQWQSRVFRTTLLCGGPGLSGVSEM